MRLLGVVFMDIFAALKNRNLNEIYEYIGSDWKVLCEKLEELGDAAENTPLQ